MKTVVWNLNHRAARRAIPEWIAKAIGQASPDVVILSEYVESPDHPSFVNALREQGLGHVTLSARRRRQNQILIATRESHARRPLEVPDIHPSVPSNALLISLPSGTNVLGFRMPAYENKDKRLKRPTWEWLLDLASTLHASPTIIAGDFNTAPGDSTEYCGDCLESFVAAGWAHALPSSGFSWQGRSVERRIDHAFLSPQLASTSANYSWAFEQLALSIPDRRTRVGLPDHAMLIVETSARSASSKECEPENPRTIVVGKPAFGIVARSNQGAAANPDLTLDPKRAR
jgi:endonuclease/exonuclease/phosphatase family metal-dependent hydrolase